MKKMIVFLAVLLLSTVSVLAQEKKPDAKPAALPSVDEVLDKYVKALGGKEAVEKVTSRIGKGVFEIEAMNMSGSLEMYQQAPNKMAMNIDLGGVGKVNQVFDGAKAWSADPMQGLRELTGAELAQMKLGAEFYRDLKLKQLYPKITVSGKETVAGKDTYVLVATPSEGPAEKWYFSVETGLMVRQDSEEAGPDGKMTVEAYLEDYRAVDGVKTPFVIKRVTPMMGMTIKFTEVKQNTTIEEAKFAKPSGQ